MMEILSPGQIYLADQRGLEENQVYRRYSSFDEKRPNFGNFIVLNDELLAVGRSLSLSIEHDCYLVIIPVTGELLVDGDTTDVGEVLVKYVNAGEQIELKNPYEADWINYLYLQIMADEKPEQQKHKFNFDLDNNQNKLVDITKSALPFSMQIGTFAGRNEALYKVEKNTSLLYAFVIAGAFEMQGRLLHERDGLALWNLAEADLEALSNNAVVLLVEIKSEK